MTTIIVTLLLKIGELVIDRFITDKKKRQEMAAWLEKMQSKGAKSARLSAQYDRLIEKYRRGVDTPPEA